MDNVRMDCSYLALFSVSRFKSVWHCIKWISSVNHVVFFSPTAVTARFGIFLHSACDLHANGGASSLSISDWRDHPWTAGKPKVLKSSKWWAEGSVGFCISHLLHGFKKKGERGQLNMHIIWGYIGSLGFKLLDERQLWINVIFSLGFGHLLRARKKVFVCVFTINVPYYCSMRFIVPHPALNDRAVSLIFLYLFTEVTL